MISLGLDPSLTGFGWCIHDSEAIGPKRVIDRGKFVTSSKEIFVKRYMDLRAHVAELLERYPLIEGVGVESPPFGEQWSEGLYGLFLYVNEALYTHRKDVVFFDPGSVKMLTKENPKLRKGKMFKSDMVAAAKLDTDTKSRWDHNEADAYLIAKYAARFWQTYKGVLTTEDLTPAEKQSFLRVHTFVRGEHAGETKHIGALFKENRRFFRYSQLPESK